MRRLPSFCPHWSAGRGHSSRGGQALCTNQLMKIGKVVGKRACPPLEEWPLPADQCGHNDGKRLIHHLHAILTGGDTATTGRLLQVEEPNPVKFGKVMKSSLFKRSYQAEDAEEEEDEEEEEAEEEEEGVSEDEDSIKSSDSEVRKWINNR